jgi:sulfoacetaldehyde dehydrogenase
MWDDGNRRKADTVAIKATKLAEAAGFEIPEDRTFIVVDGGVIGKANPFSGEKLTTLLSVFPFSDFDDAIRKMQLVFQVGGRGHSCGIYSFNEEHIDRLAREAPVSRIMVRQPNSRGNSGSFENGMPMTASLGCGTWGGNIISENVALRQYLNTTWVSMPLPEDKVTLAELYGEFYDERLEQQP